MGSAYNPSVVSRHVLSLSGRGAGKSLPRSRGWNNRIAKVLHVPLTRIAEIVRGRRGITADSALRLSRCFGTTAKFWLGLQEDCDLEEESRSKRRKLSEITAFERQHFKVP